MVDDSLRKYQLILWRENQSDPLKVYQLNTVTYGTASAPFLSTRCLLQLSEECTGTAAQVGEVIERDFYVDDLINTADSKTQLKEVITGVINKLNEACLPLRKFRTNCPEIFNEEITTNQSQDFSKDSTVLGLAWSSEGDTLQFSSNQETDTTSSKITKRIILSQTCKTFDPLGLLSACTILPKILLQKLWLVKSDWDDKVSEDIKEAWLHYSNSTSSFEKIIVPRHASVKDSKDTQLHCFTDASEKAFSACVYLRSVDNSSNVHVKLLCAKARVAPLKPATIPRLELCAALLGARLHSKVVQSLRTQISKSVFWTDSSIALSWIKTHPKTLKTFVCNRVQEIRELTEQAQWRHVPTDENPADLASRGVYPHDIVDNLMWWEGPSFLRNKESEWPSNDFIAQELPETKVALKIDTDIAEERLIKFENYSKLHSLQNIMAYILRFINNCKNKQNKMKGLLTAVERNQALKELTKLAQKDTFNQEIETLSKKIPLKTKSHILSLSPFIDPHGVLRVGGRLYNGDSAYDKKHPMLIDSKHHLSKLIFLKEHLRLLHCGPQQLLYAVREMFWPTNGGTIARSTVHNCMTCIRVKGSTSQPIMGNLPSSRITPSFPFETCGVDFAGPFCILNKKGRGARIIKCYLSLFICFASKTIHLEVVSDLSTSGFLLCLRRFIARRGKPKTICCDNGSNFVGASNELGRMLNSSRHSVNNFASSEGIEFKFNPAYSPNFGELWESGVKAAKFHLKRIAGGTGLTFEEITTLFCQIEAILNSRPLTPLSSDPSDLSVLTPGHFLIGRPLTSLPCPSTEKLQTNRYQLIEKLRRNFWDRWTKEYLCELQQKLKWKTNSNSADVGDLVILKEENLPPLKWTLGRIHKLYPGSDNITRVVDVQTKKGIIRRAVSRLCPLLHLKHMTVGTRDDAEEVET